MFRTFIPVGVGADGHLCMVDVTSLHGPSDPRPIFGCPEPRDHHGCGGLVIDHEMVARLYGVGE